MIKNMLDKDNMEKQLAELTNLDGFAIKDKLKILNNTNIADHTITLYEPNKTHDRNAKIIKTFRFIPFSKVFLLQITEGSEASWFYYTNQEDYKKAIKEAKKIEFEHDKTYNYVEIKKKALKKLLKEKNISGKLKFIFEHGNVFRFSGNEEKKIKSGITSFLKVEDMYITKIEEENTDNEKSLCYMLTTNKKAYEVALRKVKKFHIKLSKKVN